MSFKNLIISISVMLATVSGMEAGAAEKIDVDSILHQIDELYRSQSSYSEVEMEIITPHWERTMTLEFWTRGMEKTFIRVLKPKKDEGMATLRLGNEMWNYLPKTNKVIKIPPSMMMSSWMGSDFTNDDLVKEFTLFEDFDYELVEETDTGIIFINCIPHEEVPVVWGNIVIAVREEGYLPVWQKYYDEEGNLARIMTYRDVRAFDDRTIPSVMEMVPKTKEGHKTIIRYLELEFNLEVPEDIFSLRNLRSGN